MTTINKTLKPQVPCSVEIRQTFKDGKSTLVLTFESDRSKLDWIGSQDYRSFTQQALQRFIHCLIFVSPGGVEGLHLARTRPNPRFRRPTGSYFAYEGF